jgi:hypothetical protein
VAEQAELTAVSVHVSDEDLLGLHILATMEGVPGSDPDGFADVSSFALHRGIMGRFDAAGLNWPPTTEALSLAKKVGAELTETPEEVSEELARRDLRRSLEVAVLVVAAVVVLIGGYAGHWGWTGFDANGQVWDWMHLMLLPVAFGLFSVWLSNSRYMGAQRRRALGTVLLVAIGFVLAGYLAPLVWTGFKGNTLWDWLTLTVLPLTLITVNAWPKAGREFRRAHKVGGATLGVAFVVTLIGGYAANWAWTGYRGNTLWDWLSLLLAPLVIHRLLVPKLVRTASGGAQERARREKAQIAREKALAAARERLGDAPA